MTSRLGLCARISRATLVAAAFLTVAAPKLSGETLSFDGIQVSNAASRVIVATDYADYMGGNATFSSVNSGGRLYWRGAAGDGQYMHFDLTSLAGQQIVGPAYLTLQDANTTWGGGVGGSFIALANAAWTASGGATVPGATAVTSAVNATGSYVGGSSVSWGLGGSVLQGLVDNPSTNLGLAVIGGSGSTMHFNGGMSPYLSFRTGTLSTSNVAGVITGTGGDVWNSANYSFSAGGAYAAAATLTINGALTGGAAGAIVINGGQVVVNQPGGVDNAYWAVDSTRINRDGLLTINGHSHVKNLTLAGGELGASAINGQWGGWSIDGLLLATDNAVSTLSAPRVNMDATSAVQVDAGSTLNLTGSVQTGTITKTGNGVLTLVGANSLAGGVVHNAGTLQVKNDAALGSGTLTLNGAPLVLTALPGLHEGRLTVGSLDPNQANPRTATRLTTTMANTNAGWGDNQQWNYSGYVFVPTASRWTFGECIDDATWLKVDDTVVLNDGSWNNVALGSIDLTAGWHRIDARFMNGYGGAGYSGVGIWATGFGFGVDRQGRGDATPANFTTLADPGDGSVLVRDLLIANNLALSAGANEVQVPAGGAILSGVLSGAGVLRKTGSGWLTLTGTNTYAGGTTLAEGVLVAGSASALGSGDLAFAGGALRFTAGSAATAWGDRIKNSTAAITLDTGGQDLSVNGLAASNTAGLTKAGPGTLSLVGANAYAGDTRVNMGTLKLVSRSSATVGTATVSAGTGATFVASVNNRLAGLAPVANVGGGAPEGSGLTASLTDGSAAAGAGNAYSVNNGQTITFNLPTSGAPLGYDLLGAKVYTTWNDDGRDAINLESLKVATVANPNTFVALTGSGVSFDPGVGFSNLNLATILASNGVLAKDVVAVQFVFGGQENNYAGYAELEILAAAVTGTGGTNVMPTASRLFVEAGATLDLNGNQQTIAALSGAGLVTNAVTGVPVSLTVNQDANTTFSGVLTGDLTLVKAGMGVITLTGASTYGGGTAVQGGTLVLDAYNGYAPIRGTLTVNAGATVVCTGDGTGFGWQGNGAKLSKLVINGGTATTAGIMHVWDLPGGVEMTGGVLQSNGGVDTRGGNRLEWRNAHVTTLASADLAKIAGQINLRSDWGVGTGLNLTVADGAAPIDLWVSAAITESGGQSLAKYGPGKLLLTGLNTFSGGVVIHAGVLQAEASTADNGGYSSLGSGPVTIQNGATLISNSNWTTGNEWNGASVGKITVNAGGTWTINYVGSAVRNGLELNGGSIDGPAANADWGGLYLRNTSVVVGGGAISTIAVDTAMNAATTFTVASGSQLNFTGALHNSNGATGGVVKEGDGILVLAGTSNYTGATSVKVGTLVLSGTSISPSHVISAGAVLELNLSSYRDTAGTTFSGAGTLRKTGTGTIEWGSAATTFTLAAGALIDIQAGTLKGGSWANENWSANLADLNVATGAVFDGVEANVRVNRLTGTGTVKSGYGGAGYQAFTIGVDNGAGAFEGVIANSTAPANLVKEGTGTIALLGANTYTGTTQVVAGTLQIGDGGTVGTLGNGAVTIASGATLEINRAGTFATASGQTIGGAGTLVKTGSGTAIFNGSMAGLTNLVVYDGTVRTDGWNPWKDGLRLSVNGLGVFELWNTAVTVGELTGSGIIRNSANWSGYAGGAAIAVNNLTVQSGDFGGVITDNGYGNGGNTGTNGDTSLNLIKSGGGTLTLSGVSDYCGVTTLAGGVLQVAFLADNGVPSSLGLGTGDTNNDRIGLLFRGGVLKFAGSSPQTTDRAIRLSTSGGGGTIDASGSTIDATLVFSRSQMPNWWESPGARTLTLTGLNAGANTFTAGINDLPGVTTIHVNKEGVGTWVLAGAGNYLGVTDVKAGTLVAANSAALGAGGLDGATMTWVRAGATLALQGDITANEHLHMAGTGVGGQGAIRNLAGANALTQTIGLDGDTTIGVDAGTLTLSNAIYGDGGFNASNLSKTGNGTLVLSGTNLYTGATILEAGKLVVTSLGAGSGGSSLGASSPLAADKLQLKGAVTLEYAGAGESTGRSFTISGSGLTLSSVGTGPVQFTPASLLALSADGASTRTITLTGTQTGDNTFASTLLGDPAAADQIQKIVKRGVGKWVLAGSANRFRSDFTLELAGGTLGLAPGVLGGVNNTGDISVLADSTLRWEPGNADDLSSRIFLADGVRATFDVAGGELALASSMRVGAGQTASLRKTGSGTLTLSTPQTVANVSVDAGKLRVNQAAALGAGAVSVNGGTLSIATGISVPNAIQVNQGGILEGTGGAGTVSVRAGGVLSPGASPGILTMQSLVLEPGSFLDWQIFDAAGAAGVGYDRLRVTGAVDLSGLSVGNKATIRVISLAAVGPDVLGNPLNFDNNVVANTAPRSFSLATYGTLNLGANQNINDAFAVDLSQFRFSDGSLGDAGLWVVSYDSNAGTILLTAIPEPSTYGLSLGALALAVVAVRRRRQRTEDAARRR
jgi:autotransporter-associated beta strand protein